MPNSLDIIIVNWNSGTQLKTCLESLCAIDLDGVFLRRVVIIDNASQDNSIGGLEILELPLTIIRNEINIGFAAACNQGAKDSIADYLLFLNPDTSLFEGSLAKPIHFMAQKNNQNIGIVGVQLIGDEGHISRSCARFPTVGAFFSKMFGLNRLMPQVFLNHFMLEWDHQDDREVDQVIGAFFFVRRSLFKELDGFDEAFFVYFEEVDFSYRAWQAGWKSFYLASAQAYHKGGGTSETVKGTRIFYSLRSRILYGYKHFGWMQGSLLLLGTVLIEPISRLLLATSRISLPEIGQILQGFSLLWRAIPRVMSKIVKEGFS